MRLYDIKKRLRNKSVAKYSVDWGRKSRSKIQFKVKQFLKPYWKSHVVFEEFPVYGTRLKVDILNATIKAKVKKTYFNFGTIEENTKARTKIVVA